MPSTQSYVARLITDAGGRYIYQKNTGNASIPIGADRCSQDATPAQALRILLTVRRQSSEAARHLRHSQPVCGKHRRTPRSDAIPTAVRPLRIPAMQPERLRKNRDRHFYRFRICKLRINPYICTLDSFTKERPCPDGGIGRRVGLKHQ